MLLDELACDLCYSKKVKCDRKTPCGKCVNSKVECRRTRTSRPSRQKPKNDKNLQAVLERLSNLEGSLQQHKTSSQTQLPHANHSVIDLESQVAPSIVPRGRVAVANDGLHDRKQTPSSYGSGEEASAYTQRSEITSHRENEARVCIHGELSRNADLSSNQRAVLDSALRLVYQLSQRTHLPGMESASWSQNDAPGDSNIELSRADIIHSLMGGGESHFNMDSSLWFPEFLKNDTIKRMALAMLGGTINEQTATIYKVLLHFQVAVHYHTHLSREQCDSPLIRHMEDLKTRHLYASLAALDKIGFLTPPSLHLLQALITGAIITVILGDVQGCSTLTVSASRTLAALGYHLSTDPVAKTESEEEIRFCIIWCYHFDAAMSMLLHRPPALPKLQFPVVSLIHPCPTDPMRFIFGLFIQLAQIQVAAMDLEFSRPQIDDAALICGVESLQKEMTSIHSSIELVSRSIIGSGDLDLVLHQHALEFTFLSIKTTVLRFSTKMAYDVSLRQECLSCARQALLSLKEIQHINSGERNAFGSYQIYLCWLVTKYPLCPFFVIFCNVVCTANNDDFHLLEEITAGFCNLSIPNKHIAGGLHTLCLTLIRLCQPLISESNGLFDMSEISSGIADNLDPGDMALHHSPDKERTVFPSNHGSSGSHFQIRSTAFSNQRDNASHYPATESSGGLITWDDDLMWQLFCLQPSLDWYNGYNSH